MTAKHFEAAPVLCQGRQNSAARQNPFLFVVGCPRSGTTLLQRMLDAHPQLAVANDTHFIPRALERLSCRRFSDATDPSVAAELIAAARSYHRFARLALPAEVVERAAAIAKTYSEFVRLLYTEFAVQQGKPLGGEKTPDYVRRLPLLHAMFPSTQTVHIIRDGRDVALSTLEWANESRGPGKLALWREEPVAVCALWWRWQVATGRRDAASLPAGNYLEVRYEQLAGNPADVLHEITDFLRLPFATEMLSFHAGKTRRKAGLSTKKAWLPATPGLRDWRTQMDERSVELFESLAGDLLAALGYELRFPSVSPEMALVARRCERWWDEERSRRDAKRALTDA